MRKLKKKRKKKKRKKKKKRELLCLSTTFKTHILSKDYSDIVKT